MANFRTHLVGAAGPSVLLAGWLALDGQLGPFASAACVLCGIAGGLLPDVDSESSVATHIVFTVVAAASAALAASMTYHQVGDAHRLLATLASALLAYLLVRYAVSELFHAVTVHRGVIHSIPMAAACGLATFHMLERVAAVPAGAAMWPALFLTGGFIVHLLLDELYSVDLQNRRLKRSFGTALKLGSRSNRLGTLALVLADAAMVAALMR